ncbi:ketoacyl-ACP synthase III family protein [Streptomyces sp. NPDC001407]|uniref:ketoacyl-ACP synthase III family protein n=1 Tax=unclassified Streptomyces TaxID=2593676 RepID=UPI0033ED3581
MRWDDIYISGTGTWLAERVVTADEAVRTGRYTPEDAKRSGQLCLVVADDDERTPDMAVRASGQALRMAGTAPEELGTVLFGVTMHNGIDVWNSTAYVQRELGARRALGVEVRAGSNGGLAGLELACARLRARPDTGPALLTCADAWRDPHIDRWRADRGLVFGDGGSALVASAGPGFARLVSMVTTQDPELEGLHRGKQEFGPYRHSAEHPVDLFAQGREFLETMPKPEFLARCAAGVRAAVTEATEEAGTDVLQADHVVLPHFGERVLRGQCLDPLGLADFSRTTWEYARRVGHLGAGDQLAGLDHLVRGGTLEPGERIVLIGVGGGFSWTCAVLEIQERPRLPLPDRY